MNEAAYNDLIDRVNQVISPIMNVNEFISLCSEKAKSTQFTFSHIVSTAIDSYLIFGELPAWLFKSDFMREEGYYWVRMRPFGKWHIAEWYNGYWITSWSQNKYLDPYFEEIDEKRLTHE